MKSAEQIEQSIRRLNLESSPERREGVFRDLVEAHTRPKEKRPAFGRWSLRRTIMTQGTRRIAAVIALAIVLVGTLSLGTGSVALSQAGHAVNSTLARLRAIIAGTDEEPEAQSPDLPNKTGAETPNPHRKAIQYAARIFRIPENETGVRQSLKDQGIELVKVLTDPEVYCVILSREQGESFDASVTLQSFTSPRVMVSEGDTATIALTEANPRRGLALGLLASVSSDGKEVQSTISFHDGHDGFEIPNVSTESGGVVLILAKRMLPDPQNGSPSASGGSKDILIRIRVDIQ
jgi:hypothetical protein